MALEISELRSDDYDALAKLWQALEDAGPIPFASASDLTRFLHEHRGLSIVARDDGGVVAAVLCSLDGDAGCTNTLVVHPAHRDGDLSRQVFDKALKKLAARGIRCFRVCLPQDDDHSFWEAAKWPSTGTPSQANNGQRNPSFSEPQDDNPPPASETEFPSPSDDEQETDSSGDKESDDDVTMAA